MKEAIIGMKKITNQLTLVEKMKPTTYQLLPEYSINIQLTVNCVNCLPMYEKKLHFRCSLGHLEEYRMRNLAVRKNLSQPDGKTSGGPRSIASLGGHNQNKTYHKHIKRGNGNISKTAKKIVDLG